MSDDIFDVEFEQEKDAVNIEGTVSEDSGEVVEEKATALEIPEEKVTKPKKESKPKEEEKALEEVPKDTALTEDIDISFEGIEDAPGIQIADTGTKVSKYPIEKMRFTEAKKEMLSVLTSQVIIIKRHYDENTGSFFCFDGKCCEYLGLPDVRYIYPVVVYDTNKKGKPVSKDIEIKALILAKDAYDDLSSKNEFNEGGITAVDLVANCSDETYQSVTYSVAGQARWKKSNELKQYIADFWEKNAKYLTMAAGRSIKPKDFMEKMGEVDGNDQIDDEDVDFGNVF